MASGNWHVDLPFRGSRTYLHSTSLCNHLALRFPAARRFELSLRAWMAGRIRFAPSGEVADPKGAFQVTDPRHGQRVFDFTDEPEAPVTHREAYDEPAIIATTRIEGRTLISEREVRGATFFDRLIAGNKALIEQLLSPGVSLVASRIVTPGFPAVDQPFQLRLDQHLGTRLFRSFLLIDGTKTGELVFYGR